MSARGVHDEPDGLFCHNCGRGIADHRADALYCSPTCRAEARRKVKRRGKGTRAPSVYVVHEQTDYGLTALWPPVVAHDRETAIAVATDGAGIFTLDGRKFVALPDRSLRLYDAAGNPV